MRVQPPSGVQIELKELQTLPNGNFVAGANEIFTAPFYKQGIILLYTNAGTLLDTKQLFVNNQPAIIYDLKTTLQGKILVTGSLGNNSVFVTQLNSSLAADWSKTFNPSSGVQKITLQLFDDKMAIAVEHTNAVSCYLLNQQAAYVWSRKIDIPDLVSLAGFGQLNWPATGLVVNCLRNGKYLMEVFEMDVANGSLLGSHVAGNGNIQSVIGETTAFNGQTFAVGVTSESPADYRFVRYHFFHSAVFETKHTFRAGANVGFNISAAVDNAGDAMAFCIPQNGELVFIKQFAAYQTSPEHTRSYAVPINASVQAVTRSKDGGYLFGINTAANNEMILIKTDSAGMLAGCGYNDLTNDFTEVLNIQNTAVTRMLFEPGAVLQAATTSLNTTALNTAYDCNQNYCPPAPTADTCLTTYSKLFRSGSYVESLGGYTIMRNNNRMVTTTALDRILGAANQVTSGINMLNEQGEFINGVTISKNGAATTFAVYPVSDSTFMLVHYFSENNRGYYNYSLVTDNFNIKWSTTLTSNDGLDNGGIIFGGYHCDKDGNSYIVGTTLGFMQLPKINMFKIDANGNFQWGKSFEMAGGNFSSVNITSTSSSVIILVNASNPGTVSVRVDKATGAMLNSYVWQNRFNGSYTNMYVYFDTDRILYYGNSYDNNLLMGIIDTTGRPLNFMKIPDFSNTVFRAGCFKEHKFYGIFNYAVGGIYKESLIKIDTALNIEFISEAQTPVAGLPSGMAVDDNGYIYIAGNNYYGANSIYANAYINKYDPNGQLGTCVFNRLTAQTVPVNQAPQNLGNTQSVLQMIPGNYSFDMLPDTSGQSLAQLSCSSVSACDSIHLTGTDTVCSRNSSVTFRITKTAGCTLPVKIKTDTARCNIITVTDSSVTVTFKQAGNAMISASINTGCKVIKDSLPVYVFNSTATINLGADTSVCPGDSVLLTVAAGFTRYQWQDSSTGVELMAKDSGLYHVSAWDDCGGVYRDSVYIGWHNVPPLSFLPDTISLCSKDTLVMNDPPGFTGYNWLPAGIITYTAPVAQIVPQQSTWINLQATTTAGCKKTDSFFLKTLPLPAVYLGNDTAVCSYDSLQLSAAPGYSNYLWSNGSMLPSITVTAANTYWVKVTDLEGCHASDTIHFAINAVTAPELGNDFNLCAGEAKTLDAGSFAAYLWQDGSQAAFFTVTDTGLYRVMVTDTNNCKSYDSVYVQTIYPLPANFLPGNDSICGYERFTIQPAGNFSVYQWQDNSALSYFTAGKAGLYTLTVTDQNGCTGKDSITLFEKDCFEGLYIPTAFSPNNDQLHDLFKVKLYGIPAIFRIDIFNRFGEMVFSTTDPYTAWDGNYKGKPQPEGNFVFVCRYQFAGKKEWIKKGNLVLIR